MASMYTISRIDAYLMKEHIANIVVKDRIGQGLPLLLSFLSSLVVQRLDVVNILLVVLTGHFNQFIIRYFEP